ncbi:hypothetical protein BH24GEM2_BH24GEM2_09590 [soil metagenome]
MTCSATRTILIACAMACMITAPAHAQRDANAPRVAFGGTVVDLASGAPIAEAVVVLSNIRAMAITDSEGNFTFKAIPSGKHRFVVRRLGYVGIEQEVQINGGETTRISLPSQPTVLEGITIEADRLETRRRSVAVSVRALNQKQILAGAEFNAADVAATRLGITRRTCAGDGSFNCAQVRGVDVRVQVYIDDRPAFGGMEELEMYAPHELYTIESYAVGRMVRAYTMWFMEDLARKKRRLDPVILW